MISNPRVYSASLVVVLAASWVAASAQSQRTEHTYRLDGERPAATIDDVAWLAGSWSGEAFGQPFEEVWNPPSAGSMVGMFKLLGDDGVEFYELLLLLEEEGSLSLKVRHFNPDFTAWEDRDENVTFPLVRIEDDVVHFSGLSFYRVGDDEMVGYLVMKSGDEIREEKLTYRRVAPDRD